MDSTPSPSNGGDNFVSESKVQDYYVRAIKDYKPKETADRKELGFKKKDSILVLTLDDGTGWMKGKKDGEFGWFPSKCVESIQVNCDK